jgi:hypothetical protein
MPSRWSASTSSTYTVTHAYSASRHVDWVCAYTQVREEVITVSLACVRVNDVVLFRIESNAGELLWVGYRQPTAKQWATARRRAGL